MSLTRWSRKGIATVRLKYSLGELCFGLERCYCLWLRRGIATVTPDHSAIRELCWKIHSKCSSTFSLSIFTSPENLSTRAKPEVMSWLGPRSLTGASFKSRREGCSVASTYINLNVSSSLRWARAFHFSLQTNHHCTSRIEHLYRW